MNRTFVICKPDSVERGLVGRIISRFEDKGLKIVAADMRVADSDTLDKHYEEHVEKGFYPDLKAFMSRGPVVAMVLEGPEDTYAIVRSMMGATNPAESPSGDHPWRLRHRDDREPRARQRLQRVCGSRDRHLVPSALTRSAEWR